MLDAALVPAPKQHFSKDDQASGTSIDEFPSRGAAQG
jgi:hypothetical protein